MANRVVDHGIDGFQHAVFCKHCDRPHGPLYVCDGYDDSDIAAVNEGRRKYQEISRSKYPSVFTAIFPPVPPVQNWKAN